MTFIFIFAVIVAIMVLGFRKSSPGFKNISASQLVNFIKTSHLIILDIRTLHEFKSGHLPYALNVDFYSQTFQEEVSKLDPSKSYLVYCKNGDRSIKACKLMETLKFSQLFFLEHGIENWVLNHGGQLDKVD